MNPLKKLLSQIESLLADVSHEIRTPLAKMRLLLEIDKPSEKMSRINKQIDVLGSLYNLVASQYANELLIELLPENHA